jgi:hypothetical protein
MYVKVAQDDPPVRADVETWDAEPGDDLTAQRWLGSVRLPAMPAGAKVPVDRRFNRRAT